MRRYAIIVLTSFSVICACKKQIYENGEINISYCGGDELQKETKIEPSEHWVYLTTGFFSDTIKLSYEGLAKDTIMSTNHSLGYAGKFVVPSGVEYMEIINENRCYLIEIKDRYCCIYIQKKLDHIDVCYTKKPMNFQ